MNDKDKFVIQRNLLEHNCTVLLKQGRRRPITLGADWLNIIYNNFSEKVGQTKKKQVRNIMNFSDLHTSLYLDRKHDLPIVKIFDNQGNSLGQVDVKETNLTLVKCGKEKTIDEVDKSIGFSDVINKLALGQII